MSIQAGQRITAAHLSHTTQQTQLTNDTVVSTSTWEQWATEEITITNPGVSVEVSAVLLGGVSNTVDGNTVATCRAQISIDGGTTWTDGNRAFTRCGTTVGETANIGNTLAVTGTPSGDIKVRAQIWATSTNTEHRDGTIVATMIPS